MGSKTQNTKQEDYTMQVLERVRIEKLSFPVQGYRYNAQIWRSIDGGKTFCYCAYGKYFRDLWQAIQYKKAIENPAD